MKRRQRVTKTRRTGHGAGARARFLRPVTVRMKGKKGRRKGLTLMAAVEEPLRSSMEAVFEFYRPLKKPVTLRLDADVIAWFKKDGRRYQTRINAALRKVMEKEMREAGI